jgi:hypothetical protein
MKNNFTAEQTKDLKNVMSLLGKLSHKKSPRSKAMMREIGRKGGLAERRKHK